MSRVPIDFWKAVAGGLGAVLLTGAAAWLTFGQDKVSRQDMVEYVSLYGPWSKERGEVLAAIANTAKGLEELRVLVKELAAQQQAGLVEQRVLVSRVDTLVSEIERSRGGR